jgi:hypothetical protein
VPPYQEQRSLRSSSDWAHDAKEHAWVRMAVRRKEWEGVVEVLGAAAVVHLEKRSRRIVLEIWVVGDQATWRHLRGVEP